MDGQAVVTDCTSAYCRFCQVLAHLFVQRWFHIWCFFFLFFFFVFFVIVPNLSFIWCLRKAMLRDFGIFYLDPTLLAFWFLIF